MDSIIVAFGVLVVIIVVLAIFFSFFPVGLWISALASGVKIRISTLWACASAASPPPVWSIR